MSLNLSILYRGELSSCNYACNYCPFAKHWESPDELHADQQGLERFCNWIAERSDDQLGVFFTPWGEALVRSWYRKAIVGLSHLKQVTKVAVQTNLSCKLDWLKEANASKIGLWCTYHPGQVEIDTFLLQCHRLEELGVQYSVGCVGLKEHRLEIEHLRERLPAHVYMWINAYKSEPNYYDTIMQNAFADIDPLFPINNQRHVSRGHACRTGHTAITVDSLGAVRRCHFVDEVIGNINDKGFEEILQPRPCPNDTCGCHIGYVHLEKLQLYPVFGEGLLERIHEENMKFRPNRANASGLESASMRR